MILERILIEWFLRFGGLLSIVGMGMAFIREETYVNLFLYSGAGSVSIGLVLMLISMGRGRPITGPQAANVGH